MKLSKNDLSKYLGVNPSTIDRWVKQGKLPIAEEGDNYQVRAKDLEKWALKRQIKLNPPVDGKTPVPAQPLVSLAQAVQKGGVYSGIQGHDVETVLGAGVQQIEAIPEDFKTDLLERLLERETALSTGIGNGVAVPHPRDPLVYLNHPLVSICILDEPVDYKALDNQPVFALCYILSPALKNHLHLLSSLAFCLKDRSFVELLRSNPDPGQLIEKIEALPPSNSI